MSDGFSFFLKAVFFGVFWFVARESGRQSAYREMKEEKLSYENEQMRQLIDGWMRNK